MASVSLLSLEIGKKCVAVVPSAVLEVVRAVAISPLPKAPEIVEGVINFRGTLAPVLDIRRRFDIPPRPLAPEQHFVVVHAGRRTVVLRVDRALGLVEVDEAAIESARSIAPGAVYISGIAKLPDGLLVIHDLESFLSLDEAERVDAAIGEAGQGDPGVTP